ncbi:DUF309 domain-containing protein [Candidatus Poseidoniaceae archaeon]|nr:DUF309 domain-containing protein [Candidatus Poseidoniaceae archaeon]
MEVDCPLSQQEQRWLDGGITKFNSGLYWHAHEDWEEMWKSLKLREVEQRYVLGIQGLIQMTALMFQYERQKPQGIIKMWSKLTDKIGTPESPLFDGLWGVDISKVLHDVLPFHADAVADEPTWILNPNTVQI